MRFQVEKFEKRYGSGLDWRIVDTVSKRDVSAHETEGEARRVARNLERGSK